MREHLQAEDTRRVRVLAAGGTIAMASDGNGGVTPELDGPALLASMPGLENTHGIDAETVINVPSAHLTLEDQLHICREARDAARRGIGVVITHGTDTLEETAMLCDVVHDAEAPIVITGAIRPASAPGRRRPGQPQRRRERGGQRGRRRHGRAGRVRRRDPPRALRAQDGHHVAGGLLLAPDRAAGPRDRGPPDHLVEDPAQPADGPAEPGASGCWWCPRWPATTGRWPKPRWPPTRTA